jgi:hypothetical protein
MVVALTHGGPVAVPDVSVYLSFAQWPYGSLLPSDPAFFPGYGLLLTPLGWMSGSGLHTAALLLNSLAAGACVVLAARLARSLGASSKLTTVAAALAAVHPSISTSSRIAWPETCLVVVVLAICLTVDKHRWTLAGVIAGLAMALHPRVMVIVVATVVVATMKKRLMLLAKGLAPALALTGLILQWTNSWPSARLSAAQSIGDGPNPLLTASGQWLALGAGTAGLASAGLLMAMRRLRSSSTSASEMFLSVSALGMLALGGWALAGSDRIDTLLYGRYIGPWAVPLAVLGLIAVRRGDFTPKLKWVAVASTLVPLTLCLAASSAVGVSLRRIMTLGLGSVWSVLDNRLTFTLVVAASLCVVAYATMARGPSIAVAMFIVLASASTITNHGHLNEVGKIADGQVTVAALVPEGTRCLSHDASAKSYAMWLYRLELPGMQHRRVHLAAGQQPCGGYVIAGTDALNDCDGAELLATEPRAQWGLWRYPTQSCD